MSDIALPKEPTDPEVSMESFRWLIHAMPKVGKSTLASCFPSPVFLPTEAGLSGMKVHKIPEDRKKLSNWREFSKAITLLREEDHSFKTVVIDTIDNLYQMLTDQVAKENGVDHISEMGYGAGWEETNKRLWRALSDLYEAMGVVLISHSRFEEVRHGAKVVTKILPDLSKSPRRLVTGWVDIIVYLGINEKEKEDTDETLEGNALLQQRVAICQPTPYVEAGGRLSGLPDQISLGSSPSEGFDNLKGAFDKAASDFLESLS
jgi:hypothetical protein